MNRYLRILALVALGSLALIIGLNYLADPLQHYRAATYPPLLVVPSRYRLPGLARHDATPFIVAGTSVSKTQLPSDIERIFKKRALNLAMDGASAHEQSLLLRLALRTGRVTEVLWDINYEYLRGKADWVSDFDGEFPAYLYDDGFTNDLTHYLLGLDTLKNSLRIVARRARIPAYTAHKVDSFQQIPLGRPFGIEHVNRALARRHKNPQRFRKLIPLFTPEALAANFQQNIAALIRENPTVRFHLYFPPFSEAYARALQRDVPELISPFLGIRAAIHDAMPCLPNADLHDIQSDISLISDLTHYSDLIHYDRAYNVRILELIQAGTHRATPERLATYERFLRKE